jgi:S-adenosyl-L-methionine hydrolase (adenosine-forming)
VRVVTLTTDFGTSDWFVGAMKGVILGLHSRVQIVDLTHAIAPGDIQAGAFALAASYACFPKGTIHITVVDPGVGSARRGIAVATSKYIFVGPDNGVLSLALDRERIRAIYFLENPRYFRDHLSNTFHGRDIFAPVAGHLSRGVPISRVGRASAEFVKLELPIPRVTPNRIRGVVIYIDRFGNAITNIRSELLRNHPGKRIRITAGRTRIFALSKFYEEAPAGSPLALINSDACLEVAIHRGHAARRLRLKIGSPVLVEL